MREVEDDFDSLFGNLGVRPGLTPLPVQRPIPVCTSSIHSRAPC